MYPQILVPMVTAQVGLAFSEGSSDADISWDMPALATSHSGKARGFGNSHQYGGTGLNWLDRESAGIGGSFHVVTGASPAGGHVATTFRADEGTQPRPTRVESNGQSLRHVGNLDRKDERMRPFLNSGPCFCCAVKGERG